MTPIQIMVVEDESIVALEIKDRLKSLGYAVPVVATSGEEAVKQASEKQPNLVLMDIRLKGEIDGVEAAEQIRTRLDIPVVYLTAYADAHTLQRAKITEPYGYILKPFEERELHTAIEMALYKHKMERKLKESERWLATTLKSIGDAVITTDARSCVTFMNPIAEALTGWPQAEAVGKDLAEVFHIVNEETRALAENAVTRVLEEGIVVGLASHTMLIARDTTETPIDDNAAPIRDEQGNIAGVVLVFRDVSQQRRMEAELLKIQKLESLGLLAGGIAHDFNNMLTVIIGNISLMKMLLAGREAIFEKLDAMEKASLRAKGLAQQLLTFARGGAPIKKTVSLAEIITESADLALKAVHVTCQFAIPDGLLPVEADKGQISQVLNNLFTNAEEAMPHGGMLQVQAENMMIGTNPDLPLKSGNYVKVSIQDQGIGIARNDLSKIFDPYFTTKPSGSGLGLATAYSIVHRHDGYITVESKPGVGTTFFIYLPASEKEIPETKAIQEMEGRPIAGKGKILLMDDDELVRRIGGAILKHLGYQLEFAKDGAEAIELYQQAHISGEPFDAVILDLTVPGGMGGKEAIKQLLDINPNIKAIVSSGYSHDPVMSNFKEYGFSDVVVKPYSLEEMRQTLQQVILGQ